MPDVPLASNPWVAKIVAAAQKYGVDPNLALAVARQESGINPSVHDSSAGAIGMMQLMPATARSLGVNPRDPDQNIDGGTRLLGQLQAQYNGNRDLMLAGYNAGPGRVNQYLHGVPLPAETQNYIKSINGHSIGDLPASVPSAPPNVQATPQTENTNPLILASINDAIKQFTKPAPQQSIPLVTLQGIGDVNG